MSNKHKEGSAIKTLIYLIAILAVCAAAIIIFEPFRAEPPVPVITVDGEEIAATQGSYCWEGVWNAQCVDSIYTSPLDMAREHAPTEVSPKEKIEIKFAEEPIAGTLEIEQWINESTIESVDIENDFISVPNEKGVFVYHIMSRWKQGDGNYAFSIEVK